MAFWRIVGPGGERLSGIHKGEGEESPPRSLLERVLPDMAELQRIRPDDPEWVPVLRHRIAQIGMGKVFCSWHPIHPMPPLGKEDPLW
jgi:hypothetical protein